MIHKNLSHRPPLAYRLLYGVHLWWTRELGNLVHHGLRGQDSWWIVCKSWDLRFCLRLGRQQYARLFGSGRHKCEARGFTLVLLSGGKATHHLHLVPDLTHLLRPSPA